MIWPSETGSAAVASKAGRQTNSHVTARIPAKPALARLSIYISRPPHPPIAGGFRIIKVRSRARTLDPASPGRDLRWGAHGCPVSWRRRHGGIGGGRGSRNAYEIEQARDARDRGNR